MRKTLLLFLIFTLISPWFWVFSRNYKLLSPPYEQLVCIEDPVFIEQINVLRGESNRAGLSFGGRLLVNKLTFCAKSAFDRYLESFDPHFLFFVGDLSLEKSTRSTGPLYLSFLPMIIFGFFCLLKNKGGFRKRVIIFLLLAPIPASIVLAHYESITRIPLFLLLTFLASFGFWEIFSRKRVIAILLIFLFIFETSRFFHDFYFHYPRKLFEVQSTEIKEK